MKTVILIAVSCVLIQAGALAKPEGKETNNADSKNQGIEAANHVIIGGEFYYISPIQASVNAWIANRFCEDDGLKLISFDDQEKMFLIYDFLSNSEYSGRGFWTSGKQRPGEEWFWGASGLPLNFTDWAPGYPQLEGSEPEVCLWFRPSIGWYDFSCQGGFYFICEF